MQGSEGGGGKPMVGSGGGGKPKRDPEARVSAKRNPGGSTLTQKRTDAPSRPYVDQPEPRGGARGGRKERPRSQGER